MNALLIFILALPQVPGMIARDKNIEEVEYTDTVMMPKHGNGRKQLRYHYPTDRGYIERIHPRCYDVRDQQLPKGPGPFIKEANDEGFTIIAPAGHTVTVSCRAFKAKGPLA